MSWIKQRKVQNIFHSNKKGNYKTGNETVQTTSYKIKLIDAARLMTSSLSNIVDNLTERIHKIKCKDCDCFPEYESVKDNFIKYKCLSFKKDYSNKLDEELKKKFKNTFKFSNNDINRFILLLRKGVYPYKYIDDLEKFNETTLAEKEEFYIYRKYYRCRLQTWRKIL